MSEAASFRTRVLHLASTSLDVASRPARASALASVVELVESDPLCREALGKGGLAAEASKVGCASVRSRERLVAALRAGIIASVRPEGEENDDDDDDDEDSTRALCRALCLVLGRAESATLVDDAVSAFRGAASSSVTARLSETFATIAEKAAGANNNNGGGGGNSSYVVYPALSLASALMTANEGDDGDDGDDETERRRERLAELFVSAALSPEFPAPGRVVAARPLLLGTSQRTFDARVAPALGLKLRAHPDRVLPIAEVVLASLVGGGDNGGSTAKTTIIDVSSHLVDGANLLPSVTKHLKSSKAEMRGCAWRTLVLLAQLGSKSASTATAALCDALAAGGAAGLNSAEHRAGAYAALEGIARIVLARDDDNNDDDEKDIGAAADAALRALATCLPRDKNAASSSSSSSGGGSEGPVAREAGIAALFAWMRVAKRNGAAAAAGAKKGGGGYDKALDHLAEPCVKYGPKDGEFRFRLGSLVVPPSSEHLTTVIGLKGTAYDAGWETFLESTVADLLERKEKVRKGLEGIVDAAVKKHAASDAVPQTDGALAVFLLVLHESANPTKFPLPASAAKAIAAGSTFKGESFLYAPALLEAATARVPPADGAFLNHALHRLVALRCKTAAKESDNAAVGGKQKQQQPLVRVVGKRMEEGKDRPYGAAARALAACVANPRRPRPSSGPCSPAGGRPCVHVGLKTVCTYSAASSKASDAVAYALFDEVNLLSRKDDEARRGANGTRAARERREPIDESYNKLPAPSTGGEDHRGGLSDTAPHRNYDPASVRRAADALLMSNTTATKDAGALGRALALSHAGTTRRAGRRQRVALAGRTLNVLKETAVPFAKGDAGATDELAGFLATCASSSTLRTTPKKEGDDGPQDKKEGGGDGDDDAPRISPSLHEAAACLIGTLGGIAGNFDAEEDDPDDEDIAPYALAHELCVRKLPALLASRLADVLKGVEALTEEDVALYRGPAGELFRPPGSEAAANGGAGAAKPAEKKKGKAKGKRGGGFDAFEDEEWERQVKKDLAKKKKLTETAKAQEAPLTKEEKELLGTQTLRREELARALDVDLPRALAAVRSLCLSDIEVGNAALPALGAGVVAAVVSRCPALDALPALREDCEGTLTTLASCVYEIDEAHAPALARALAISCGGGDEDGGDGKAKEPTALPVPCAGAAVAIFEMEDYGDRLSDESFSFLLPILRAALSGPRNVPGCDDALRVLERHASPPAAPRKETAAAVLELLRHDRCRSFANPTPYEALVAIYANGDDDEGTKGPSAAEAAPLLGERGALGCENARVASMDALAAIAASHPKLVRTNPLIENRVWLNCHAAEDRVRQAARGAWLAAHGGDPQDADTAAPPDPPSKMYAVPMLPLLSHGDESVAGAAARATAAAMGMHPGEPARKNLVKLCNLYVSNFPAPESGEEDEPKKASASASPFPVQPPPAAKKKPVKKKVPFDTGLPKKTKTKKTSHVSGSMAKITGGPPVRKSAATKKMLAKSLGAPKKERTLDQGDLMSQFKAPASASSAAGAKKKKVPAEEDSEDKVAVRLGALRAVSALTDKSANYAPDLPSLKILLGFLMAYGLGDGNEGVRNASRNAARDTVAAFGSSDEAIALFLPQFETVLATGRFANDEMLDPLPAEKVPKTIAASDYRKEGVVVSLGSIALHLKNDADEDRIDGIVDMLLNALKTPSEDVQSSVALCLSKLMKKGRTQKRVAGLLDDLVNECVRGASLASRRGAAYGISAAVKGSGIASLKKYEVAKRLEEACASGDPEAKEGSLFCIELLSARLGILFEPYVIVLLPALLKAFSDANDHVRKAADRTVGSIMGKLSGHGVKLVMPAVLDAFAEPEWRTKQASIRMLASMSHCAPKQLAKCLPQVVPKLTEAFSDTHPKVKSSAEEALEEICGVIKNPEIAGIGPVLLRALTDASGTLRALEALISTEFVHAIDAPSLSIIVPVVHRGLRDRAATTKRYAALISGNICTMVNDPRDFVPYLPILLPDLKSTLLDPIPDVRSISAKSLGSLTRGLGEATFPDLRSWLVDTLRSEEGSSVERSGAAQGLSELLVAGGAHITENVMINEILPLRSHPKPGTREGVLWVLTFLPSVLGQAYASLIDESLPALLGGLADDNEAVRDVALRAGRVLVRSHGKAHKDKILPSLEEGLGDEDYRIRVASLTLLGDLLGMLGGTKVGKANTDTQDDIRQAERAQAQIALALGDVTRKRVLGGLYLARSDTAAIVRQSAVQVWKTVVSVTPRTLREILPVLVDQIVAALGGGDPERTQVAGRCLGDVVHKLGDQVLPEIIPVLRDNLYRGDEHARQGVCVGLAEVIDCSSKEQIGKYVDVLVKVVQDALCDEDERVRVMAASCFQNLYNLVGNRTLDEIVPALLVAMEGDDDEAKARALNGMTGILGVRSRELLPYIVPRLLKSLTISHAEALASISGATGGTIHMHFSTIIPKLIFELASFSDVNDDDDEEEEKEREEAVRRCFRAVCYNVETTGVNWLISEIASKCAHDKESVRKEACWSFQAVVEERQKEADFYEQVPIIIRELLHRLNDDSTVVLKANNKALGALTKCVPAEELVTHIQFIRNLIASMVSDARYRKGGVGDGNFFLPGFNMPKGLEPLLPIYQRGILYGDATVRETAAAGLGELITITANKYLAGPFLIKLTGPLLRIVGDRNPSAVKIAIVQTLGLILTKGGPVLRAFVPQFQTTFVKALSDPSRQVRIEAIKALALLMPLSTRVDPLIKELVATSLGKGSNATTVETAGMVAIQTATLEALAIVLKHGGKKVKVAESIPSSLDAGKELLVTHEDDGIRESAAKVIGYACELLGTESANSILQEFVLDKASNLSSCSIEIKHGIACICRRVFSRSVGQEIDRTIYDSASNTIQTLMKDDKTLVKEAACVAIGAVLGSSTEVESTLPSLEKNIVKCMDTKEELDVQQAVANGLCITARLQPGMFRTQEGLLLINSALKMAMSGAQRVQFSYNDFLWIALDVRNGDGGLEEYLSLAHFDSAKKMQAIYSKVLVKIKAVNDDEL